MTTAAATEIATEVAYFDGEFLSRTDYADAQSHQIAMQRLGASALFDWGVVSGLDVTPAGTGFDIAPGLAVDKDGRLILLDRNRHMDGPSGIEILYLTIAYAETRLPPLGSGPPYIREGAVLEWRGETMLDADAGVRLVLGAWTPGAQPPSFAPLRRRYAGAPVGSVRFRQPDNGLPPGITGWNCGDDTGLRIDAPDAGVAVSVAAAAGKPALLSVTGGNLGIGTLSPCALLHVQGSNVARQGPGTLTSDHLTVTGSDALGRIIHVGDLLMAQDRAGVARQATVRQVFDEDDPTRFITDTPLDCENAPFTYKQQLLVSVRGLLRDAGNAFVVDRLGQVGFGVPFPQSRLHVGNGDLALALPGSVVRFGGDGRIATLADAGETAAPSEDADVALLPGTRRVEFRSAGPIDWSAGNLSVPAMTLTAKGQVGIGLDREPAAALDVGGAIRSTAGGFVFPDGSVQTTAQISVPIGTVVDWWGGQFDLQVPPAYQICDGSTVKDLESPLFGVALPNLADCFILGTEHTKWADSTPFGSDDHTHTYQPSQHDHEMPHQHVLKSTGPTGPAVAADPPGDGHAPPGGIAAQGHAHSVAADEVTVGSPSPLRTEPNSGPPTCDTERASRVPPYVGLMKLMRIK